MTKLRSKRLLIVVGKGGVGRTSVSLALGLASAQAGLRTCLVALGGETDLARAAGIATPSYEPQVVTENLHIMTIDPSSCLSDFSQRKLRLPKAASHVLRKGILQTFAETVPGLGDAIQLGKIENLLREPVASDPVFDTMVVDAPATGHAFGLLRSARVLKELATRGPIHQLASIICDLLEDSTMTALVAVTLPQALPLSETLELIETMPQPIALCITNRVLPFSPPRLKQWPTIKSALQDADQATSAQILELFVRRVEEEGRSLTTLKQHLQHHSPQTLQHVLNEEWAASPLHRAQQHAAALTALFEANHG